MQVPALLIYAKPLLEWWLVTGSATDSLYKYNQYNHVPVMRVYQNSIRVVSNRMASEKYIHESMIVLTAFQSTPFSK